MKAATVQAPNFKVPLLMAFNFFSSVSIIIVNKHLFVEYSYSYATFVTVIHFIITFIGLHLLAMQGHFEVKKVALRSVLTLALSFCGFVVFNNLSLQYNSVGCYQLMKVMTTPVITFIQTVFFHAPLDNRLKWSLVPICFGVIMATVNDLDINFIGVLTGVAGILSTSLYQIFVKVRQQELGLNSYQLLYYQAPLSAMLVLPFVPVFDKVLGTGGLLAYNYSAHPGVGLTILATGLLAFCVNLSIYLVIGSTSPISYNVLGHFKLCVILFSGWLFFQENMNPKKLAGTIMAFIGVVLYTHIKQYVENEWHKRPNAGPQESAVNAAEIVPLKKLDEDKEGAHEDLHAHAPPSTEPPEVKVDVKV